MGRPRNFDPDQVLDLAREIFWQRGYKATSLDDITEATKLKKTSLYAAFGDKASLFLKILDRYHEWLLARSAGILQGDLRGQAAIEAWFDSFRSIASGKDGHRGCLSVNTSTDGGLDDEAIRDSIQNFNARVEHMILSRLQADRSQFSHDFDPATATKTIMSIYFGIMVIARQRSATPEAEAVISQVSKLFA